MKLYIIRHGETQWNKLGRLQGQTDIALNENGKMLAVKTGVSLQEVPFSGIISSPLGRAVETAKLVMGGRNIPLSTDPGLAEICFGCLEGCLVSDPDRPEITQKIASFFHQPEQYEAPEGGESIRQLLTRTNRFLETLALRADDGAGEELLLISTHGAALRALLSNLKKSPISAFWDTGVPKNCAVSIVTRAEKEWHILEQDKIYYE